MLPPKPQNLILVINDVTGSTDLEDVEYFGMKTKYRAQRNRRMEIMYIRAYYISRMHAYIYIYRITYNGFVITTDFRKR